MASRWEIYRQARVTLPNRILAWPFHGHGLSSLGLNGQAVWEPWPLPGPDELLVRVDALSLCASDAKMVRMGRAYPLSLRTRFRGGAGAAGP